MSYGTSAPPGCSRRWPPRRGRRRRRRTVWLPVVLIGLLVALATPLVGVGAAAADDGLVRPLRPVSRQASGDGFVPAPMTLLRDDWDESPAVVEELVSDGELPATYDLRTLDRLSAVRNQNPYGTCWSFAALASLESGLLPGEAADYSEDNLVLRSGYEFADPYDTGGNDSMATAYLARGDGPVAEQDDPYGDGVTPPDAPLRKRVHEELRVPAADGSEQTALKQAVMEHGAVTASLYWSGSCYNATYAAYYMPPGVSSYSNHAVAIVGWNDEYPRDRFRTVPAGDGAWIVRNSWGTAWGEAGYFYVSYSDPLIGTGACAYGGAVSPDSYDRTYQYDTLGLVSGYGYWSPTAWFACCHEAAATEEVAAVAFYALAPGTQYQVWLGTGMSQPDLGAMTQVAQGTLTMAGYHTVAVPAGRRVTAGTGFIVAVRVITPDELYPVPIEMRWAGYSDASQGAPGQSYVSASGSSWTDFDSEGVEGDVCLKVLTRDAAAPDDPPADDPPADDPPVDDPPVDDPPPDDPPPDDPPADDPAPDDPPADDPPPDDPPADDPPAADSTAPVTSAQGTGSRWGRTAAAILVTATDQGSGVAGVEYRVDGGAWRRAAASGARTLTARIQVRAPRDHGNDGVHRIEYRSRDIAGNVERVRSRVVRIDTRGPRTAVVKRATVRRGRRAVIRFRVTDPGPGGSTARVSIVIRRRGGKVVARIVLRAGVTIDRTVARSFRCGLPRGKYRVQVLARDTAGNPQRTIRSAVLVVR